ncbi:aspartate--tRNA ligase, mitochondrial [Bicyclus anynana]|uniref:Aspartate--tRNA ligase, mitochondrial n=1 Tax=Bicyclus anynana TaxID=110368 RepID=A0A6J1P7I4_BICAN|nr:aspartate--tRNA ligase, mitochondrial [Bicyclus anynana]
MLGRSIKCTGLINNLYNINNSLKVRNTLQTILRNNQVLKYQRALSTQRLEINTKETNQKPADSSTFTYRTHTCGELRSEHIGQDVILCGWVQYTRLSKFLLIRDSYGLTQCIINNTLIDISSLPLETIVKVKGTVAPRPKDMYNHEMATGEVEIVINKLEILNNVTKLPFNLRNYQKPKEQLRLQHRYIDLRFPEMQSVLRQRSSMLHRMRRFLVEEHNFVEVETPTLFCRTPGGAREFVVPTHHSGLFYSLVQSPQQFKQMLMAGGVDRYFQIARCYRDESTRPDRQPEFTQLDIELSFTSLEGIINLIELLLRKTFDGKLPKSPFKTITYKEALENYGTDKPNLKYDIKLKNVSNLFSHPSTDFGAFVLPYNNKLGKLSAKNREKINEVRKKYNVKVVLNEKITKEVGHDISNEIRIIAGETNDNILSMGDKENVCLCLGEIRDFLATDLKLKGLINVNENLEPLWIIDFPLFVKGEDGLETCHHPFTAPHPDDLHLLDSEPLNVRSLAYDIVLNGHEIGGGSVRIHNSALQEKILNMLNIDSSKLSHFINALQSGCPPHAGIALGIDRLMAVLCDAESIRDVIAFPKSHDGRDPLSGAPNKISSDDQKYYHIKCLET